MTAILTSANLIAATCGLHFAACVIHVSELVTPSGQAVIIQSGPDSQKPRVRKKVGEGYSILEQQSSGNHAVIFQSTDPDPSQAMPK